MFTARPKPDMLCVVEEAAASSAFSTTVLYTEYPHGSGLKYFHLEYYYRLLSEQAGIVLLSFDFIFPRII